MQVKGYGATSAEVPVAPIVLNAGRWDHMIFRLILNIVGYVIPISTWFVVSGGLPFIRLFRDTRL